MTYPQVARPMRRPAPRRRRRRGRSLLILPLIAFSAVALMAATYVGYVLWPRWPGAATGLDAPSLPIVIGGETFNIEPGAIRRAVQRHAGTQTRVDLDYRWPNLAPADIASAPQAPLDQRLFVTIQESDGSLPPDERFKTIYPRYLTVDTGTIQDGLAQRAFRDDTPYRGEELAVDAASPLRFIARCTLRGVTDDGNCMVERRIGAADITFRFPRAWLEHWRDVATGIDKLTARLHPAQ